MLTYLERIASIDHPVVPTVLVRKNSNTRKYIITGSLLLLCFIAGIWFNQYISKGDASLVVNTKYQNNNKDNNKADKNALPSNKELLQIVKLHAEEI